MKKLCSLLLALLVLAACAFSVLAEDSKVIYSGDAGSFIFEPGSQESPTDLFPHFRDVMPGDVMTQTITVRNDASNKVKVKIYMRSLGAEEGSEEFLSQLRLRVEKTGDSDLAYLFDAAADQSAQLTDWVLLGTLYSGGALDLNVILEVPVEMDNEFQERIGILDWEFKVEELPISSDDPQPPYTGDDSNRLLWTVTFSVSFVILLILAYLLLKGGRKRGRNRSEEAL